MDVRGAGERPTHRILPAHYTGSSSALYGRACVIAIMTAYGIENTTATMVAFRGSTHRRHSDPLEPAAKFLEPPPARNAPRSGSGPRPQPMIGSRTPISCGAASNSTKKHGSDSAAGEHR